MDVRTYVQIPPVFYKTLSTFRAKPKKACNKQRQGYTELVVSPSEAGLGLQASMMPAQASQRLVLPKYSTVP